MLTDFPFILATYPDHPAQTDRRRDQDRAGAGGQADLRHRRQRHRHASRLRAVRRRWPGRKSSMCPIAARRRRSPTCWASASISRWIPRPCSCRLHQGRPAARDRRHRVAAVLRVAGRADDRATRRERLRGDILARRRRSGGLAGAIRQQDQCGDQRDPGRAGRDRAAAGVRQRNAARPRRTASRRGSPTTSPNGPRSWPTPTSRGSSAGPGEMESVGAADAVCSPPPNQNPACRVWSLYTCRKRASPQPAGGGVGGGGRSKDPMPCPRVRTTSQVQESEKPKPAALECRRQP